MYGDWMRRPSLGQVAHLTTTGRQNLVGVLLRSYADLDQAVHDLLDSECSRSSFTSCASLAKRSPRTCRCWVHLVSSTIWATLPSAVITLTMGRSCRRPTS